MPRGQSAGEMTWPSPETTLSHQHTIVCNMDSMGRMVRQHTRTADTSHYGRMAYSLPGYNCQECST